MKSLDTSTITAHALGELEPPQERLLRMTFSSPDEAAALEQECEEILGMAALLRTALQKDLPGLTAAQRTEILSRTAEPYPSGKALPPDTRTGRERRRTQRDPAWMATLFTAGAAAAVMVVLAQLRTKEPAPRAGGAVATDVDGVWDPTAPKFKIRQPRPDAEPPGRDPQKIAAGLPQSMQDLAAKPAVPPGPAPVPSADALATGSKITPPKALPQATAKVENPAAPQGPAAGEKQAASAPAPPSSRVPRPGPLPGKKAFASPKE